MRDAQQVIDNLRVLLVEDSFESMNLTRNMLKDFGITQVFTAKNGFEALELIGTFDGEDFVDVVLCDWNMPRLTGMELLRQIRTCDADLLFLMITGLADYDSVAEAHSCGVTGYIKKPFSADQLKKKLSLVARILAHRRQDERVTAR